MTVDPTLLRCRCQASLPPSHFDFDFQPLGAAGQTLACLLLAILILLGTTSRDPAPRPRHHRQNKHKQTTNTNTNTLDRGFPFWLIGPPPSHRSISPSKIGRASCRERV